MFKQFVVLFVAVVALSVQAGWFSPDSRDVKDAILAGRCLELMFKYVETDSIEIEKENRDDLWYVSFVMKDKYDGKRERLSGQVKVGKNKHGKYCLHFVNADKKSVADKKSDQEIGARKPELPNGAVLFSTAKPLRTDKCKELSHLKAKFKSFCGYEFGEKYSAFSTYGLEQKFIKQNYFGFNKVDLNYGVDIEHVGGIGLNEVIVSAPISGLKEEQVKEKIRMVLNDLREKYDITFTREGDVYVYATEGGKICITLKADNRIAGPQRIWLSVFNGLADKRGKL